MRALFLAPLAALALPLSASAQTFDLDLVIGVWHDPDGLEFHIERRDGQVHLVHSVDYNDGEVYPVRLDRFTPSQITFGVLVPSTDATVNYEVTSLTPGQMQARWWGSVGEGTETLTRVGDGAQAQPPAGAGPVGVWRDTETETRFWVEEVHSRPLLTGGVDANGRPLFMSDRQTTSSAISWSYHVVSSGYDLRYDCPLPAGAHEWRCTWSGTAGKGVEVLVRD